MWCQLCFVQSLLPKFGVHLGAGLGSEMSTPFSAKTSANETSSDLMYPAGILFIDLQIIFGCLTAAAGKHCPCGKNPAAWCHLSLATEAVDTLAESSVAPPTCHPNVVPAVFCAVIAAEIRCAFGRRFGVRNEHTFFCQNFGKWNQLWLDVSSWHSFHWSSDHLRLLNCSSWETLSMREKQLRDIYILRVPSTMNPTCNKKGSLYMIFDIYKIVQSITQESGL